MYDFHPIFNIENYKLFWLLFRCIKISEPHPLLDKDTTYFCNQLLNFKISVATLCSMVTQKHGASHMCMMLFPLIIIFSLDCDANIINQVISLLMRQLIWLVREVNFVYLGYSKSFDKISLNLIEKLRNGLDEQWSGLRTSWRVELRGRWLESVAWGLVGGQ